MKESTNLIGYAGVYATVDEAKGDFEVIKAAHRKNWIGEYDAALFTKTTEGKVKVLDIDATERKSGARAGAIVGAVLGVIFPPSILVSAGLGATFGAAAGNFAKGFDKGDIKEIAHKLHPGETGILLFADATFDAGAEKLMKRAKKFVQQTVKANMHELEAELSHA
jgi:uncharacterized membrane protein